MSHTAVPSLSGPPSLRPDDVPTTSLLAARGIVKTYRSGTVEVNALRGVDLDVAAGELLTVMGPSGHGKTTLLNCLSGLDSIDGGSVVVDGDDIHEMSDGARTEHRARRMGFIFQSFNLIPVLSAVENVELPLLAVGVKGRDARQRAGAMLDLLQDVNGNGQALVVVTHDDAVGHSGDRLVRIEDGVIASEELTR
jgi:ABC-type lipoprotein export system ATPase subunit